MEIIHKSKIFQILKIVWVLFRPYKARLVFLFIIVFISGLLESLNLVALYPVMNYGLKQPSEGIILKFFNTLLPFLSIDNLFLASCILLIIITIVAVSVKIINYFVSYKLMIKMVADYQKRILENYVTADYSFFVKNQQGRLIYIGTIAAKQAGSMVLYTITALNDLLSLLLIFSLLVFLTWQGTLAIVFVGIFYFLILKKILRKIIYKSGRLAQEAGQEKNIVLNELITGVKIIKVFQMFKLWKEKYNHAVDKALYNEFKMLMGRVFPESLMKVIFYLLVAVLGVIISYNAGDDIVPWIPLYGTFALITSRLFPAIQNVGSDLMVLTASLPNTETVYNLLNESTHKIPQGVKVLQNFHRKISFQDVWFKFDDEKEYLFKGINFDIKRDKTTAIVGHSGYGKTTLINLLLRLYIPDKGQITIDDVDISKYTDNSYLSKIGYVSQETFIYNDTIFENIKFGLENCNKDMIIRAAKQANAHEFIMNTPKGYDTLVGDAGIKLSGGQRQRIAIARAMLRKPELMVLDEATSALDNIAEEKVQEAINTISQYTTVVIIAHRLSTIQNADTILVLDKGKIVEQGKHEELLGNKGTYYELYNKQLTLKN